MKKIYVLLGYPGSGKTTLAKKMQEQYDCVHVSADKLGYTLKVQGFTDKEIIKQLEFPQLYIEETICLWNKENKNNVVLDLWFKNIKDQASFIRMFKVSIHTLYKEETEAIAVIMDTSKEESIKRFKMREHISEDKNVWYEPFTLAIPTKEQKIYDEIIRSSDVITE